MPPRRGVATRGRKKNDQVNPRTIQSTTNTPQLTATNISEEQQITKTKSSFVVAPLIVETESLSKV